MADRVTAVTATWFARAVGEETLAARFSGPITAGKLALAFAERPDLEFLAWAEAHGLASHTPPEVTQATLGPLPPTPVRASFTSDRMLRALFADDFGDYRIARTEYRRAVVLGPGRRRAAQSLLSTGLIHGAPWRPAAVGALRLAAAHWPGRFWPVQQLLLYLTWNGHTAQAWRLATRALAATGDDGLRLQAANVAKEIEPAAAVELAAAAQATALNEGRARRAAWATLCLSLALRWTGEIDRAGVEAARLADGFDALAGPVWRAWGHFELGAVAALRGDADQGVAQMRLAREVFTAAGAQDFVYDALCGEIAAERLRDHDAARDVFGRAQGMLDDGTRTSRFARDVLLVEEGELARSDGRLVAAETAFRRLGSSPTVAQQVLGLLGEGEVQRARGETPVAARRALERSQELRFGFGEAHAALTLALAGEISGGDAEAIVTKCRFSPPERRDCDGLLRFCLGPEPELHAISFP